MRRKMNILYDKILGCIAGSYIGSAMGAPVEGWSSERIEKEYGVLDRMLPYAHYEKSAKGGGRMRMAGTTEDGIERQKLICTAMIEKQGRITAQELAEIWIRDINPDNFGVQMQPTDKTMYDLMVAGKGFEVAGYQKIGHYSFLPATELGRFSVAPGTVAFARSCQPLGVLSAFDPWQAAQDAMDLGRMYLASNDVALFWGAAVTAGIAEAMKPDADVEAVLKAAEAVVPVQVWAEIEQGLDIARSCSDTRQMCAEFNRIYVNTAGFNPLSKAHEIVTKGFALFFKTGGRTQEGVVAAVNFGRDTDCLAAVVGGLTGALTGTDYIPDAWIEEVDAATAVNTYTVSNLSLEQTCRGLFNALSHELAQQSTRIRFAQALSGEQPLP
jgi:ADP-ribosylglycohydrolase